MSKEFYFSQYESPNIVIIPNMSSFKSPSPKRRKVGNSIVPIVKDSSETKEFKRKQQHKRPISSANADTCEDPSKNLYGNSSRKSTSLQSIGLDKQSTTSNRQRRQIPQKSSQTSISVEATRNLASDVCINSKCVLKSDIENSNVKKTPNKIVSDKNILNGKTNGPTGLRNNVFNDNLKEVRQSKNNPLKRSSRSFENNQNLTKILSKDKKDKFKLKHFKKCDNHTQPLKNSSCKIKSYKDECSKKVEQTSLVTLKHQKNKKQDKDKKPSSTSVAIKNVHKQDKEIPTAKNEKKLKHTHSSRSRPESDVTSNYRDKHENQEHTIAETTDIKTTKKKIFNSNTLKKAKTNIEKENRKNHSKSVINITNEKLLKKKSESKTKKKAINTDVKSTGPKTDNQSSVKVSFPIKLILNLICKDPHPAFHNKNSIECNSNKPYVDIDFLDDINVDEIVESLYTCEKKAEAKQVSSDRKLNKSHNIKALEENSNTSQSDATDLVKILKSEDDAALISMPIENAEIVESLYTSEKKAKCKQVSSDTKLNKSHNIKALEENSNMSQSDAKELIKILKGEEDDDLISKSIKNAEILQYNNESPVFTQSYQRSDMFDDVSKSLETIHSNSNIISPTVIKEKQLTNPEDDTSLIENINIVKPSCEELKYNEVKKETEQNMEQIKEKQKNNSLNSKSLPTVDVVKFDTFGTVSNNSTSFLPHKITAVNVMDTSTIKKEVIIIDDNRELEETKNSNKHFQNNLIGDAQQLIVQELEKKNVKECQNLNVLNENKIVSITKSKYMEIETLEEHLLKYTGLKYSVRTVIHNGKFSKIFQSKNQMGKYYALKILTDTPYYLGKRKSEMVNTLIQGISKDNLFIVYVANTFNIADKWCFLMEWYPKNLRQALDEKETPFLIEHIQNFARQLTMAAMVLKKNNMVHLDINPTHILINYSKTCLKLCGFDNLRFINNMSVLPTTGCVNYRAPEVILGFRAGFAIDVWSIGLVLFEMATKKKLFPGLFNNSILYKQICTLGCVPYEMINKSLFAGDHFMGSDFMRRFGKEGKNITIIKNFYKNNILNNSIYAAYYTYCAKTRTLPQILYDIGKLSEFVQLLQQMLILHPEFRMPIEYVHTNPFITNIYTHQQWNNSGMMGHQVS